MTTGTVTTPQNAETGVAGGEDISRAWRDMRSDDSLQFGEVDLPERDPPPDWLRDLLDWLGELFAPVARALVQAWPWLQYVLLAIALAALLWFLWRLIEPQLDRRRDKPRQREEWTPDQAEALALLEEADRLAEEGRYDEATHLLLKRSVGQIAAARPDLVDPSSTARELSAEPRIPHGARSAFRTIAERVEASLFALRKLSRDDWQVARAAYADFALQQDALAA